METGSEKRTIKQDDMILNLDFDLLVELHMDDVFEVLLVVGFKFFFTK